MFCSKPTYLSIFFFRCTISSKMLHHLFPKWCKLRAFPNSYRLPTLSIDLLTNISPINQTVKSASPQYSRTCSQQRNIKKQNLMVPSNSLLNSVHENVQKLIPCRKNNQVISIFPRGLKKPQNTSHPPWKPCLGEKGTIHLFSQLKQWLRTFFSSKFNEELDGAIKFCLRMS